VALNNSCHFLVALTTIQSIFLFYTLQIFDVDKDAGELLICGGTNWDLTGRKQLPKGGRRSYILYAEKWFSFLTPWTAWAYPIIYLYNYLIIYSIYISVLYELIAERHKRRKR